MLTARSLFVVTVIAISFDAIAGCSSAAPNGHQAPTDAGSSTVDGQSPTPIVPRSPLGAGCSTDADCVSGFCTDGVCCDSACDQTCYACNQTAAMGHCAALTSGEDPSATVACTLPSACDLPASTAVPACKFVDGTACQADGDCVSGHCITFYVDADGDGYGSANSSRFCAELNAAPPPGYAAYTGDCCDLDAGANPGFDSSQFLSMPDTCGSFDWNCDGKQTQQQACPTAVACGAACAVNLGFFTFTAFTEACN